MDVQMTAKTFTLIVHLCISFDCSDKLFNLPWLVNATNPRQHNQIKRFSGVRTLSDFDLINVFNKRQPVGTWYHLNALFRTEELVYFPFYLYL